MLESLSSKQKIIFFIIIIIMLLFIVYFFYITFYKDSSDFESTIISASAENLVENKNIFYDSDEKEEEKNSIIVYICGAVQEEKVITLSENSRIIDAIEKAGGLTENADLSNINLAYLLEDGEKIYIPQKGEQSTENALTFNNKSSSTNEGTSITKEKININKAGQAELESIPGIGPSTALKIIEYRSQNGKFSSIEDIKNVSGIGNGKYEKIKDYITVK